MRKHRLMGEYLQLLCLRILRKASNVIQRQFPVLDPIETQEVIVERHRMLVIIVATTIADRRRNTENVARCSVYLALSNGGGTTLRHYQTKQYK